MAPSVAATEDVSGHGAGLNKQAKVPAGVSSAAEEKLVLNTIRCLAADLCQQVSVSRSGATAAADQAVQGWTSWNCHGRRYYRYCSLEISHAVQSQERRLVRS